MYIDSYWLFRGGNKNAYKANRYHEISRGFPV